MYKNMCDMIDNNLPKIKTILYQIFLLTLGNALCVFAVLTILVPHKFLSGGLTGLSLIIYYKSQILSVGLLYLLINIPIFLTSLKLLGVRFVVYTGLSILIYSTMLFIPLFPLPITDKFLAAVTAGIFSGVGGALMMRSYGSPGGADIISILLYKYAGISVGVASVIFNAVIMAVSVFIFPLENILYTFIFIVVSAKVLDMIFHGLSKRKAFIIISVHWKDIIDEINNKTQIGATLLQGKGSFNGGENQIIYSIVNKKDVMPLKKMIMKKDPCAFIAIMEASDVVSDNVGNQPHW